MTHHPMGMVIAYVDDLIAVGDQSQLNCMKTELDKLYVMKTSGSIPAKYQPNLEPLRFLGCLIERMPDGQIIMHQRSYIEHCFRENDMELIKGGVTLPNVDEKGSPESPVDQYGHPTEFEKSKSTCQKYIGQLMWLATRTRPDISPVLGMIASQMVIRPTEMVKCLIHLWRYIKGTSGLSMTSFSPNSTSVFGRLRLNVYVDASFSSGGSRSRSGMTMYLVDTTDGSESIIQWASRRQTSMAASAPEAEVTAMAEGFATAIFLFDSLKEIQVITGFGPNCILSMKTDSAVALKQMNTHTVTVRTRTAAQKLAFLRELIYQDPQIQPIYIPGPSQRADAQTKCLSGPALRKAQEYLNLRHVVTPVVNMIRVIGLDRSVADSSACERLEGSKAGKESIDTGDSHVVSVSPSQSLQERHGQNQVQEEGQDHSQTIVCDLGQKTTPLLCRLRMNFRDQDLSNVFLQDYRCVVTVIRQENVDVDACDKCYSLPCVCGSSFHMPRKEEGSAHKRSKPQTPAPTGAISSADERAKADKEAQRAERSQARLKALQNATDSAKAPMRGQDTASDTSTRQKTAKPADKQASSTQASSSVAGDTPTPKAKASIRKRPAHSDDTGTLSPTPAGSETSQPAVADSQQPIPSIEESPGHPAEPQQGNVPVEGMQSSQPDEAMPQQGNVPVEGVQSSQPEEATSVESSGVKRRVVRKGSAAIAEQGSISNLKGDEGSVTSASNPKAKSPSIPKAVAPKQSVFKNKQWSDLEDDPPESLSAAGPDTVPMAKADPTPVPKTLNPTAATVVASQQGSSSKGKFLLQANETNEWPVQEPKVKIPMWKKRDAFLHHFLNKRVVIAQCPTGLGKSTILPVLAAMHLHPKAGRVCCTQIRRVTTQFVCRDTKIIWGIDRESQLIGFKHGTEKSERWSEERTKVLFLTEGIIMRQVMSHDEEKYPDSILPGCRVLLLDEVHSGSTDIELILARILPRISQVQNFRLVLTSATLNVDTFLHRVTSSGVDRSDVGVFLMEERANPLALHCLPPDLLRSRDNMELALRMIIKIHHEYRNGYKESAESIQGPILVFVPGKAEIRLLTELIKGAVKRRYTSGLFPYGFHADTPDRDRVFLTTGDPDPDGSRYGELVNFNNGKKYEEKHPCNASDDARVKNPDSLPWRRVIISTNAAETAVTFKDCWAVIDTCLVNQVIYDPVAKTQVHATVPCPKTASKQRAGRAGRTTPGINIKLITQQEWDNLPDTEPPQPQLEDPIPIFLRLMRHSTIEVRNRVLDTLGIEQGLRAYAMEHLWVNNMVNTEGELTKLGRFAADMEPNDPENAALLWYGHQFNVLREATIIYVLVTRGGSLVNPKVKSLYPHPDGDFHTMVNIWNAAEWTHHQTKDLDPRKRNDEQILIKVWGRLGTSRRQYMILKDHLKRTAEKCCKLLGTMPDRVIGPPRTDRLAATRLSLALFNCFWY